MLFSQFVFVTDRAVEQGRIIGIDRDLDPGFTQLVERMRCEVLEDVERDVAAQANLEGQLAIRQFLNQFGIIDSADTVTDPLDRQVVDNFPDTISAKRLTGMNRIAQAEIVLGELESFLELDGPVDSFITGHAETGQVVANPWVLQ